MKTDNTGSIRVFHKKGFVLTLVMKVRVRLFGCPVLELLFTHHPPVQGFEKEKVEYTEDCEHGRMQCSAISGKFWIV